MTILLESSLLERGQVDEAVALKQTALPQQRFVQRLPEQTEVATSQNLIPESSQHVASSIDIDELIRQITRIIKRETNLGVQEMRVYFEEGRIVLAGYCKTFYTKQIAQEAAMKILTGENLVNMIRVA